MLQRLSKVEFAKKETLVPNWRGHGVGLYTMLDMALSRNEGFLIGCPEELVDDSAIRVFWPDLNHLKAFNKMGSNLLYFVWSEYHKRWYVLQQKNNSRRKARELRDTLERLIHPLLSEPCDPVYANPSEKLLAVLNSNPYGYLPEFDLLALSLVHNYNYLNIAEYSQT